MVRSMEQNKKTPSSRATVRNITKVELGGTAQFEDGTRGLCKLILQESDPAITPKARSDAIDKNDARNQEAFAGIYRWDASFLPGAAAVVCGLKVQLAKMVSMPTPPSTTNPIAEGVYAALFGNSEYLFDKKRDFQVRVQDRQQELLAKGKQRRPDVEVLPDIEQEKALEIIVNALTPLVQEVVRLKEESALFKIKEHEWALNAAALEVRCMEAREDLDDAHTRLSTLQAERKWLYEIATQLRQSNGILKAFIKVACPALFSLENCPPSLQRKRAGDKAAST